LRHQIRDIAWSPDGRTLYALDLVGFVSPVPEHRLHTLDPDTGAIRTTVVVPIDRRLTFLTALVVDANGAVLAVAVDYSTGNIVSDLWRLDPATGVPMRPGRTGFRELAGRAFTPDFRTLYALTALQVPPVLLALDSTTGQATPIAETDLPTQAESLAFTADGRLLVAGGDGNLYELDPGTGASTLIGPTGVEVVSGMSLRVLR
jgi:outer membrane protein assembly factor BamB